MEIKSGRVKGFRSSRGHDGSHWAGEIWTRLQAVGKLFQVEWTTRKKALRWEGVCLMCSFYKTQLNLWGKKINRSVFSRQKVVRSIIKLRGIRVQIRDLYILVYAQWKKNIEAFANNLGDFFNGSIRSPTGRPSFCSLTHFYWYFPPHIQLGFIERTHFLFYTHISFNYVVYNYILSLHT